VKLRSRLVFLFLLYACAASAFQPDRALLRRVYEDYVARCERDFGPNDPRTAQAARDLGFFLKDSGDRKAANLAFAKALKIDQAKWGDTAPQALAGMIALASVSTPADAESILRSALASPSMNSRLGVPALSTLGDLRLSAGDRAGAAACWRLSLQHAELAYGKDSDEVAKILFSLSQVVGAQESVQLLGRALTIAQRSWGENHPETATCQVNLANALLKAGKTHDAAEKAQAGLSGFEASLGPHHPRVAVALITLAEALHAQGDLSTAQALYRRAIEIDRQALGAADPRTLQDLSALKALMR
jgi:tetratricopeptide (TPR) repeat protein